MSDPGTRAPSFAPWNTPGLFLWRGWTRSCPLYALDNMNWAAGKEPLLERSAELARMEAALGEARLGRGRFVVIEGPAGIGKTALLAAARTAAADSEMCVLRSRGTELEREFAFGVVRQLVEPPLADASELERSELLQSTAGVAAALLGLPGAPASD